MSELLRWLMVPVLVMAAGCGGTDPAAAAPSRANDDAPAAPDLATSPVQKTAPVAPQTRDVVGSWTTQGGDFEEITLASDGSWSSFLHARPLYSGTWSLADATLTLTSSDIAEPLVVSEIAVTTTQLIGVSGGNKTRWTRIATAK